MYMCSHIYNTILISFRDYKDSQYIMLSCKALNRSSGVVVFQKVLFLQVSSQHYCQCVTTTSGYITLQKPCTMHCSNCMLEILYYQNNSSTIIIVYISTTTHTCTDKHCTCILKHCTCIFKLVKICTCTLRPAIHVPCRFLPCIIGVTQQLYLLWDLHSVICVQRSR